MNDLYDRWLQRYPVPFTGCMVETRFGMTHVVASGQPDAPPLLLLHGAGLNALMWFNQIEELSQHYRVYAVDIPGQGGKSARTTLSTRTSAASDWVAQTLDGLGIDQTLIVGFSLGGWFTLQFALHYPERIKRMVLLAPGGIIRVPVFKVASYALPALLIGKPGYKRFVVNTAVTTYDEEILDALASILQIAGFRYAIIPPPLRDEELCRIQVPSLLLIGTSDFFFTPHRLIERVRRCQPHTTIHQLEACEHAIPFDQPVLMMQHILAFFAS